MALRQLQTGPLLQALLPAYNGPLRASIVHPLLRPLPQLLPPIRIPAALSVISGLSSLLGGIWESILRAVPKKKTSHMKKRHRQMAGKALKDETALNKCSSCGRVKKAHFLCPYCVQSVMAKFKSMGLRKAFEPKPLKKSDKYDKERWHSG